MKYTHLVLVALLAGSIVMTGSAAAATDDHTARAALAEGEPRLDHTRREEAEGKMVWEKLQSKQVECSVLSDDDFERLGEYFMGQMAGSSHEAMNNMMIQMMGEEGEEQMHVAMGKRMSGCDASAPYPAGMMGFGPMMGGNSMMGNWSVPLNQSYTNNMMGFGYGPMWGGFGWLWMILWWALVIVAIVALVRWVARQGKGEAGKSALTILEERYAKGEIDKREFEEKKRDLQR